MNDAMLTTFDNKENPFEDFIAWLKEDARLGHDTCGLLANRAATSQIYSDEMNEHFIDEAMKSIVEDFPLIYKIVTKKSFDRTL